MTPDDKKNVPNSKQGMVELCVGRVQVLFPYSSTACQKSGSRNKKEVQ